MSAEMKTLIDRAGNDKLTPQERSSALTQLIGTGRQTLFRGQPAEYVDTLLMAYRNQLTMRPELLNCTVQSQANALQQVAINGWSIGTALPECYLIPYGQTLTMIPSYRGLLKWVERTGEVLGAPRCHAVYEGERFDVRMVDGELEIDHGYDLDNPNRASDNDEAITNVYAVATFRDGRKVRHVMTRRELESHRQQYSRSKKDSPWDSSKREMFYKVLVSQMIRRQMLPVSVEDRRVLDAAEAVQSGSVVVQATGWDVIDDQPKRIAETSDDQHAGRSEGQEAAQ